jgi:hypothetical protein
MLVSVCAVAAAGPQHQKQWWGLDVMKDGQQQQSATGLVSGLAVCRSTSGADGTSLVSALTVMLVSVCAVAAAGQQHQQQWWGVKRGSRRSAAAVCQKLGVGGGNHAVQHMVQMVQWQQCTFKKQQHQLI